MNIEQLSSHSNSQSNIVPFDSRRVAKASSRAAQPSASRSVWNWLWNGLNHLLILNTEPKIYQKRDRHGNSYFRVYDPVTGMTTAFGTEQEIRMWLDQRYYVQ